MTITGPGSTFAPDGWPVLDFNFVRSAVEVCGTCTLTMSHLVLRQERKGTGPNFDVFVGQPGSKVVSRRLYRLRQACTPPKMQLTAVQKLRRSTLLPGSTLPQQIALRNVTYKVGMFGAVFVLGPQALADTADATNAPQRWPAIRIREGRATDWRIMH